MFNIKFNDLLDLNTSMMASHYTAATILVNIVTALALGLFIYMIYKWTYTGVLYSKNLGITIVMVCVVTSLIVMAISGNLALSLGMIGALSIVRFRTPVKDPRDLAFLFWAVATGVICGIGAYLLGLTSAVFIALALALLNRRLGWREPYLLVVQSGSVQSTAVADVLKTSCQSFKERSRTLTKDRCETVYEIALKRSAPDVVLRAVQALPGIDKVVMVSYEGDLDEPR